MQNRVVICSKFDTINIILSRNGIPKRVISLFPVIYYSYIVVYSVHWSKNPSIDSLGKYDKIVSNAKLMIIYKV